MLRDLRLALRTIKTAPLFALGVIVTIAIGIGPTTAIFSIVHSLLLRALPYRDPENIAVVLRHRNAGDVAPVSGPDFADFRDRSTSFADMAVASWSGSFNVGDVADPVRVEGSNVSARFFTVLGAAPLLGALPSGAPVGESKRVVLSYALWESAFGKSPAVIGKRIRLSGASHEVVAVMPREFAYPEKAQLWVPFDLTTAKLGHRALHQYRVLGRLRPGVSVKQAEADLRRIATQIGNENPDTSRGIGVSVLSIRESLTGTVRKPLLVLLGAVLLLLLIACSNAANLMLTRATSRQREFAVRMSLGATTGRLTRQLLTESILLSFVGGALGLLLAYGSLSLVRKLGVAYFPRPELIAIDTTVLAFSAAACLLTGVVFGLAPLGAAGSAATALKSGARTETNRGLESRALRDGIMIAVVALSYFLLIGAGLLMRSYLRLRSVDVGFQPERVLSFRTFLPLATHPDPAERTRFAERLVEALRATPGIEAAATLSGLPLENTMSGDITLPGLADPTTARRIASFTEVGPGFFSTLRIPLLEGRDFTEDDTRQLMPKLEALERGEKVDPPAVIVNQALARRYFGARSPLGQQLFIGGELPGIVVGVVGDVRQKGVTNPAPAHVYLPLGTPLPPHPMSFVVRTTSAPATAITAVRRHLRELDPEVPPYLVRTMDEVIGDAVAAPRFHAVLLSFFAAVALALATIGIYSVVSYGVSRRRWEMGVRMALGASSGDLAALVVGRVLKLAVAGIAIGVAGALMLTRVVETLLYEISAADPRSFAAVAGLLVVTAIVAAANPARQAVRVDPNVSLRAE